jgi:zinc protease
MISAHTSNSLQWRTVAGFKALLLATTLCLDLAAHAALPIEHAQVKDGVEVFWIESHALPMVDIQIDFDAGSWHDPQQKSGLASSTALMLSKGVRAKGSVQALDENQLGQAWAELGAGFAASAGQDRMSITLRSLVKPELLSKAVMLAAQEIALPSFNPTIWSRERSAFISAIKEGETKPATVAGKLFQSHVMGSHPYGAIHTEKSVAAIEVKDLMEFHRNYFNPCRAKVSLVGDVDANRAIEIATQLMSLLPAPKRCADDSERKGLALSPVKPLAAAEDLRVPFKSAQAHVLMGQPGVARSDERYFALLVGNYILGGGGFVSRLTDQVREKRGLSYSVYSYFSPQVQAGPFTVGLQTRADQANQAIDVVHQVVNEFLKDGPTPQELKAAKDNLIGGFALRIDSNKKLLDNVANIAWNHLPLDYLQTWTEQVDRVSLTDINQAFRSVLTPEHWVTVVVGGAP